VDHLQRALQADPQSTWGGYGKEEMTRIKNDLRVHEETLRATLAGTDEALREQVLTVYQGQAEPIRATLTSWVP